jgi:hypothetical protein
MMILLSLIASMVLTTAALGFIEPKPKPKSVLDE